MIKNNLLYFQKLNYRFLLITIIILLSVTNSGCLHKYVLSKLYFNISGKVIDSDNKDTLSFVEIIFWDDYYSIVLGKSDTNGIFNVELDYKYCLKIPLHDSLTKNVRKNRNEKFSIEFTKEGYHSKKIPYSTVVITKDDNGVYTYDVGTVELEKSQ